MKKTFIIIIVLVLSLLFSCSCVIFRCLRNRLMFSASLFSTVLPPFVFYRNYRAYVEPLKEITGMNGKLIFILLV